MGDVTREEVERALGKLERDGCCINGSFEAGEAAKATVMSLFDAAIRQAREGALEEAAVIAEDLAEHGTHIADAIRALAKGADQ